MLMLTAGIVKLTARRVGMDLPEEYVNPGKDS